jgi:hypothetical protein
MLGHHLRPAFDQAEERCDAHAAAEIRHHLRVVGDE